MPKVYRLKRTFRVSVYDTVTADSPEEAKKKVEELYPLHYGPICEILCDHRGVSFDNATDEVTYLYGEK